MKTITVHDDCTEIRLQERIGAPFERTLCGFDLDKEQTHGGKAPSSVLVDGKPAPFQWSAGEAKLFVHLSLTPGGAATVKIAFDSPAKNAKAKTAKKAAAAAKPSRRIKTLKGATVVLTSTGAAKLPPLGKQKFNPPADSFSVPAPISALRLGQAPWRGRGYLDVRSRVTSIDCRLVESGPLFDRLEVRYEFQDGGTFVFQCMAVEGEGWLRIGEQAHAGPKARWWLDFSGPWLPDHATLLDSSIAYTDRRLTYFKDIREGRLYRWTQASQIADFREGVGFYSSQADEYFGWFVADGNNWRGARTNFLEFWQRRMLKNQPLSKGEETFGCNWDWMPPSGTIPAQGKPMHEPHLTVETLLNSTCLHYGLVIGAKKEFLYDGPIPEHDLEWYNGPLLADKWKKLRSPLRALCIQQGLLPLDTVKDWRLSSENVAWATGSVDRCHRLFEDKLKADERAADITANANEILARMEQYLAMQSAGYFLSRGPASTNPVTLRATAPYAFLFRDMVRQNLVPADQRSRLTAMFLFLAYLSSQESFYPAHSSMAAYDSEEATEPTFMGMCNQNFLTDVYATHGAISLTFDHPAGKQWLARFNELFGRQLDFYMYPSSGVWEESHTYFHHVLYTVLPVALELQSRGIRDWFADERFGRLAGSLLHTFTPPDPNYGARIVAPLGDHDAYSKSPTPNILAEGFKRSNPSLAAHLAWMAKENGYAGSPVVPPVAPKVQSSIVEGLAGVFRHKDALGESMVILRVGASWGHHNNDELSLHFYSCGEPVLVEAGYGGPKKTYSKYGPSGHSGMAPVEFEPLCYLGKFNRGWMEEFEADKAPWHMRGARLVTMLNGVRRDGNPAIPLDIFPYRQEREVFFLPPEVLIIRDRHDGVYDHQLFWHSGGKDMQAQGNRLVITGHSRNSLLITFTDTKYEVGHDENPRGYKTVGACGKIGKQKEIITVIVCRPAGAGKPLPQVQYENGKVLIDGKPVWGG